MPKCLLPLLIALPLLWTVPAAAQQTDFLDALPNCNFTGAAPDDNVILGAVVYNLQTGEGCAENLDVAFPVASVPKLFVAGALFDTILQSGGVISFDTELTFTERYWMGGSTDCLNGASLNQQVRLGELSDIMIACSDNAATWMIMDAVGWETVDAYVASLGIEDIGQVIPYSEVDRQKLVYLDQTWASVPISMASRYYRSEGTVGLDAYFADLPAYTREQEIEANKAYFDSNNFNSLTPRAMARYLLKLTQDAPKTDNEGQIARWVFNTMLLTDRQYTAQAIPGTISVASKNGFDTGLRAEVNVMFENLPEGQRNPTAFALVFARQQDFDVPNLQPPVNVNDGVINRYLLTLAPIISDKLYPNYTKPPVVNTEIISSVVVNPKLLMDNCWEPYAREGYLLQFRGQLEGCWLSQPRSFLTTNDFIGVGLVLTNLNERDTRLAFVFTDPAGTQRSYQTQEFFRESAAVYWFHPVEDGVPGMWTVDIFLNRSLVYTDQIEVQQGF